MAQLKKAATDRKNQHLHGDILEEQGIPEEEEEEEEEATQDQEPSSTVTVFENLSLNTNANNNWERRGSGLWSGRMILERQDAAEDAPCPHIIRTMGVSNNFVSKSSPELSHEDVDPVHGDGAEEGVEWWPLPTQETEGKAGEEYCSDRPLTLHPYAKTHSMGGGRVTSSLN